MFQFIKSMLSDVDNQASSKRASMLYLVFVIWTFVHVMVFKFIKPFPVDTANTLILYDVVLITTFGGYAIAEKIWGRPSIGQAPVPDSPPSTTPTGEPRPDKDEAVK